MSAVFSHAVRCEFCSLQSDFIGNPGGTGGKRGPSVGVRVSQAATRSAGVITRSQTFLTEMQKPDQLPVTLSNWELPGEMERFAGWIAF
jgi:hypothetical protein